MCVSLLGSVLLVGSCGKDPLFEQGDYIYENDDFGNMVATAQHDTIGAVTIKPM